MTHPTGDTGLILFDGAHDPLYFVTFVGVTAGPPTDAYLRRLDGVLKRGKPYAMIVDLGRTVSADRENWKKFADFMRERRAEIERLTIGSALVVRNSEVRTAVTGVAWMEPIRGPHAICLNTETAMQWMRERFKEKGIPFPVQAAPQAVQPL